jgi:hypothetical protein
METGAMTIAFFYAIGTGAGGIAGPLLFSALVSTGQVSDTVVAFSVDAALMIAAGVVEIFFGVRAERQALEQVARPLSAARAPASNDGSGQRRRRPPADKETATTIRRGRHREGRACPWKEESKDAGGAADRGIGAARRRRAEA